VLQPCALYHNKKSARQQLFLAASALYVLTGESHFREEADQYFDPRADLFHINWNSVYGLGVAVLAGVDDGQAAVMPSRSASEYQQLLKRTVQQWSACSNKGASGEKCRCVHAVYILQSVSKSAHTLHDCIAAVGALPTPTVTSMFASCAATASW
jgi:hypothetical protein